MDLVIAVRNLLLREPVYWERNILLLIAASSSLESPVTYLCLSTGFLTHPIILLNWAFRKNPKSTRGFYVAL